MLFKKCKQPARLHKKEESHLKEKIIEQLKFIKCVLSTPEIMTILIFIIIFCIVIGFALHESVTYFVYNRGGI